MVRLLTADEQEKVRFTDDLAEAIRRAAEYALEYEECDFDAEVSVTLVDNDAIRKMNNEFRGIDRATDVLSFPMLEFDENGEADGEYDVNENGDVILGDIVISLERAKEQAEEYGHGLLRETAFLTVHSMLHLLGYDHVSDEEEAAVMFNKQEEILTHLGYTRGEKA